MLCSSRLEQGERACVREAGRQRALLPFGCAAHSSPGAKLTPSLSLLLRWPNDAEHIFLPERRSRLV